MVKIEFAKSEENDADLFMKILLGYLFEEHAKTSFYFMAAASGRKPGQLTALAPHDVGFHYCFSHALCDYPWNPGACCPPSAEKIEPMSSK